MRKMLHSHLDSHTHTHAQKLKIVQTTMDPVKCAYDGRFFKYIIIGIRVHRARKMLKTPHLQLVCMHVLYLFFTELYVSGFLGCAASCECMAYAFSSAIHSFFCTNIKLPATIIICGKKSLCVRSSSPLYVMCREEILLPSYMSMLMARSHTHISMDVVICILNYKSR